MQTRSARRKWIARALLFVVLLLLATLGGTGLYLRSRISPERISAEISGLLHKRLGFTLSIGELRFTWSGYAELKKICVRNALMRSSRCLLEADIVRLDLRLLPLLKKNIEIRGAHLDKVALNLFTEAQTGADSKNLVLKSWEGEPAATQTSPAAAQSQRTVKLENLKITGGSISHEAPVLPLPQGITRYQLNMREAGKKLSLSVELPDNSRAKSELSLESANFFASARALFSGPKLAAGDQISGTIDCERCNLAALDARAGPLSGRLHILAGENEARVTAENAALTTHSAYAPNLTWSGFIAVRLPELLPSAGEGSLTAPGVTLRYTDLSGKTKAGTELTFDAAADLARMPAFAAKGIQLALYAKGSVRARLVSAHFQGKALTYRAGGIDIRSESFSGTFSGNRLSVRQQRFLFGGNAADVTLNADLLAGKIPVTGSAAFGDLNLEAFYGGATSMNSAAAPAGQATAAGRIDANIRLSAERLAFGKLKGDKFSALLATDGSRVQLSQLQLVIGRGKVSGSYRREASGAQNVALVFSAVKAQDLSPLLGFRATVYGDMNADARLDFSGSTPDTILKSATGSVSFRIGRGKIRDSFLQKGVLGGPLHKLEEKFSDIEFASAAAEVKFVQGNIKVQKLFFDAEEWNVSYRAEAGSDWQGKATLNFRFRSSFVENVANPLHMGISERKEGDFYDLPFACRGNVLSGSCYVKNW